MITMFTFAVLGYVWWLAGSARRLALETGERLSLEAREWDRIASLVSAGGAAVPVPPPVHGGRDEATPAGAAAGLARAELDSGGHGGVAYAGAASHGAGAVGVEGRGSAAHGANLAGTVDAGVVGEGVDADRGSAAEAGMGPAVKAGVAGHGVYADGLVGHGAAAHGADLAGTVDDGADRGRAAEAGMEPAVKAGAAGHGVDADGLVGRGAAAHGADLAGTVDADADRGSTAGAGMEPAVKAGAAGHGVYADSGNGAGPGMGSMGTIGAGGAGWEERIGGNWLNKLGALLLVIGVALFLGYSFAHMGPGGRAATAVSLSLALLGAGVRTERIERYRMFSRGLIAAGWASLYFTSYAMTSLDGARVIDNPLASLLLPVSVAVGMVLHSLRYRVQSLTALAFGCVFAALAFSSINVIVAVALVPLAVSMLYLSRRLGWQELAVLAAAATYAVFLTRPPSGAPLYEIQSMLLVFWLLFEAFDILQKGRPILFAVNALAGVLASAVLWERMAPESLWQFSAGAALLYLASTVARFAVGAGTRHAYTLGIAAALAALGIFNGVPRFWTGLAYIAEAEALFLAGHFLRIRVAKWFSWPAFAGAAIALVTQEGTTALLGRSFHVWAPGIGLLALTLHGNRWLDRAASYWTYAASVLVALVLVSESTPDVIGLGWTVYGLLLLVTGVRRGVADFRLQSYFLLICGAVFSAFAPLAWVAGIQLSIAYVVAVMRVPDVAAWERELLRWFGAAATAAFAGLLLWLEVPAEYAGAAMMVASLGLFELGLRRRPKELTFPALTLTVAGLSLLWTNSNWRPLTVAAVVLYALLFRVLRRTEPEHMVVRLAAAWVGSLVALLAFWVGLPHASLVWPVAGLALLVLEVGRFAGEPGVVWNARALTTAAMLAAAAADRPGQLLVMAAVQWWFWQRAGEFWHGWSAAGLFVAALSRQFPSDLLGAWTGAGVTFTVLAQFVPAAWRKHFRWQEAGMGVAVLGLMVFGEAPLAQQAVAAAWLLGMVAVRKEPAYSVAAALGTGVAIFHAASGGMLTLGWSLEGIGFLIYGFGIREKTLRLAGLGVLAGCILKAFLFDLANLDTIYRIASFIGLGLILLAVSWIYSRYKDSLERYL